MLKAESDFNNANNSYHSTVNKQSYLSSQLDYFRGQKNQVFQSSDCPTCKRAMRNETKISVIEDFNKKITEEKEAMTVAK
jgi:hypothetical protein